MKSTASLLNCASYAHSPSLIRALRGLPIINTRLCAFTLTNKHLTRFFLSCIVVSIIKYDSRLKSPRKATGPYLIPLKVIKFASNVIDCHLYNIMIKDLDKNKYAEEPKTTLLRPIFKKNERNKQCISYQGNVVYCIYI